MDVSWLELVVLALVIGSLIAAVLFRGPDHNLYADWAARLGLDYRDRDDTVLNRYFGFDPLGHGDESAVDVVTGVRREIHWAVFQYRSTTGSGEHETTRRYHVVAATVPYFLTHLRIRPEGLLDKLKGLAGFEDINFESDAFSRRYFVACGDRKFAYDLIHPQMIDYLMSLPPTDWQLAGNVILLYSESVEPPIELQRMMGTIEGLVDRIPDFLRHDRAISTAR